jgi:putative membrane protein
MGLAQKGSATGASNHLTASERRFVEEILQRGRNEVAVARMALTQGADSDVRSFAQRLVDDHSARNAKLAKIAKDHNHPPKLNTTMNDHLAGLRGSEFDKAFLQELLEKRRAEVAIFEEAEADTANPDLRSFIASTLPTLGDHLKQAESLKNLAGYP